MTFDLHAAGLQNVVRETQFESSSYLRAGLKRHTLFLRPFDASLRPPTGRPACARDGTTERRPRAMQDIVAARRCGGSCRL